MASYTNNQEMIPDRRSSLDGRPGRQGTSEMVDYPTAGGGTTSLPSTTRTKLQCLVDPKSADSTAGHNSKYAKFDINGPNVTHHDNIYLKPVTKTTVRHVEIEEIERVVTIDRHIHHIQYHFQNVVKPNAEVRDRHSYYELVDPRLNITQHEPVFHAPVEHKLKYQAVSREEFMDAQTAIRPGSEMDHFEEHISIGGVGRPIPNVQSASGSTSPRQASTSATPGNFIPSSSPRQSNSPRLATSPRQTSSSNRQSGSNAYGTAL